MRKPDIQKCLIDTWDSKAVKVRSTDEMGSDYSKPLEIMSHTEHACLRIGTETMFKPSMRHKMLDFLLDLAEYYCIGLACKAPSAVHVVAAIAFPRRKLLKRNTSEYGRVSVPLRCTIWKGADSS